MNAILDPVWPWDRLWALLLAMPATDRALTLLAALAALTLPMLALSRPTLRGPFPLALAALMGWGAVLLARYASLVQAPALCLLLYGPPALAGVALGSYLGEPRGAVTRVPRGRVLSVLVLRVVALFLVLLAIARPAFAWTERAEARATILLAIDYSRSMTILDETGGTSRWKRILSALESARPLLRKLRDEAGIDARFVKFASDVGEFELSAPGEPDGRSTDFGTMLRTLHDQRDPARSPRALLVFSDGGDNGVNIQALAAAGRWRALPCPVHAFGVGKTTTTRMQDDVALTSIATSPLPSVPMKGKLAVKVTIDAHGYENKRGTLKLFVEAPDESGKVTEREAFSRIIRMPLRTGNEEEMLIDAPAVACEAKVRVTVVTDPPDSMPLNNTIETFVTVSKEGTSVLLVDRARRERAFIHDALAGDPRIRVTSINVFGGGGTLALDGQPYDAIVLGDVSAEQLRAIDPKALEKIEAMVGKGAGLMMLGGYRSFAAGGYGKTPLANVLPVDLGEDVQEETPAAITPTEDGPRLARYLFDLDGTADPLKAWSKLARLEGHTVLRLPKPPRGNETVLATIGPEKAPVLILGSYSSGKDRAAVARVLAFGGDTTWRWVRDEESKALFERFWRRVAVWLARQEDAEGGVWVRPDSRRIPVRSDLGFACGVRARGGGEVPGAKLEAEVVGPGGQVTKVPLSRGRDETRGLFQATQAPGVYRVAVRGDGKESSARVIVFDEDVELSRPAADPAFLKKLADAGGGESLRIEELGEFLGRLAEQPAGAGEGRRVLRPDWRTEERSGFLATFLAVFCAVACLEWALRRLWGMA